MKNSKLTLASLISITLSLFTGAKAFANIDDLTIPELQEKMAAGKLTSARLTQFYLQQIEALNPKLHAVITVNPSALKDAQQADQQRQSGKPLGLLHGIPLLLKDNIDTADGMPNTGGSVLLKDNIPQQDAFIVSQLRNAGAIILGKANLSEWANFRSTRSSSGWSGMGGQTRNPYDITRTPCGSSSGSGVAVAANMTQVAIGTETDGSITCPSSANGVVGIKPTVGSVSRSGIIPISSNHDTAGPMARSVTDAVYLLQAILGEDKQDRLSFASDNITNHQLLKHLKADGLKGKRIGIVTNYESAHPEVNAIFKRAVRIMQDAGAIIVKDAQIETKGKWHKQQYNTLLWDFKDEVAEYLKTTKLGVKTLNDLIVQNKEHSEQELVVFGQEIFETANQTQGKSEPDYEKNLTEMMAMARENGIDATLKKHNLDILIAPTTGPAWKIDAINGDHFQGSATSPAAVSGYPHITVPMGYVLHLPVGISFFSGKNTEPTLIEAAYHFEQITKVRRPPYVK